MSGVLVFILALAVVSLLFLKFWQHEQRQNADVEELRQIAYASGSTEKEKAVRLEAMSLFRMMEEALNAPFLEYDSLNGYQKLACGQDIRMLIVGDSIGARVWTNHVARWIEENYQVVCEAKNISMGGNTSYGGLVSEKLMDEEESWDLAIVCYGQNDLPDVFPEQYEALLRELLRRNNRCNVVCVLESSQREYTEKMQKIIELASYYGMQVADTIESFLNSGYSHEKLTEDGVHPNEQGEEIYALTVEAIIRENVAAEYARKTEIIQSALEENRGADAEAFIHPVVTKPPLNEAAIAYDHFQYYPSSTFRRVSDTDWDMEADGFTGIPGISRNMCPGDNTLRIYVNDELYFDSGENPWKIGFHLMTVDRLTDTPDDFDGQIRLNFATKECADEFFGLIFTSFEKKQ